MALCCSWLLVTVSAVFLSSITHSQNIYLGNKRCAHVRGTMNINMTVPCQTNNDNRAVYTIKQRRRHSWPQVYCRIWTTATSPLGRVEQGLLKSKCSQAVVITHVLSQVFVVFLSLSNHHNHRRLSRIFGSRLAQTEHNDLWPPSRLLHKFAHSRQA